ncbi:MAG: hypothetical protein ABIK68_02225 [bacterium]
MRNIKKRWLTRLMMVLLVSLLLSGCWVSRPGRRNGDGQGPRRDGSGGGPCTWSSNIQP